MHDAKRPVYSGFAEPQADAASVVVTVRAAALTGFDRAVARRAHYFKMPDGPFVVGKEGVAQHSNGKRLYFNVNAPLAPFGSMVERTLIDARFSFSVPDAVSDETAAALGNPGLAAWLALSWRAGLRPGETVLILGATGISGLIAVSAAKRLRAGRVIAVGRNRDVLERGKRLGADAIVGLTGTTDLVGAYREAAHGNVDVVLDYICGASAEAALEVLSVGGRLVHIGTRAASALNVSGATARRVSASILGFAYYHAPIETQARAYAELCRMACAGEIALDIERRPLSQIETAWDVDEAVNRGRQVLVPGS